jgi:hypothetical protein
MAVDSDHTPFVIDPGRAGKIGRELELAGIEHALLTNREGGLTSGVALSADAAAVHGSAVVAAQFREQVFDVLAGGSPLSVSLPCLGQGPAPHDALSAVCELLQLAARDAGAASADIGVAIDAESLSPQAAWLIRSRFLGSGLLYPMPGGLTMCPDETVFERDRHEHFWLQLWHLRMTKNIRPAYSPFVSSRCPLLSAEIASGIIPASDIQAPVGSAWVSMTLNVASFADSDGSLRDTLFEQALRRAVELGDELHAAAVWPTAQMRHDAWLNRRLAIKLTGFGDLLRLRRLNPSRFIALEGLCEVLRQGQDVVHGQSRQIAAQAGHLPALEQADPSRLLPGGQMRDGWGKRWQQALEHTAVRHRNLLVLSPWSVFPADEPADYRYSNLLPLLRFADACSFCEPPNVSHWNVRQFRNFHQRAWAVLQQRDTAHQIAEGV